MLRERSGQGPVHQRLRDLALFAEFTDDELALADGMLGETIVDAGQRLTTQGAGGKEFWVIAEGLASVIRDGVEVERLGPGGFFGEHALLRDDHRTADVIALTPMRLRVAGPRAFARLVRELPGFGTRVERADRQRQAGDVVSRRTETDTAGR